MFTLKVEFMLTLSFHSYQKSQRKSAFSTREEKLFQGSLNCLFFYKPHVHLLFNLMFTEKLNIVKAKYWLINTAWFWKWVFTAMVLISFQLLSVPSYLCCLCLLIYCKAQDKSALTHIVCWYDTRKEPCFNIY